MQTEVKSLVETAKLQTYIDTLPLTPAQVVELKALAMNAITATAEHACFLAKRAGDTAAKQVTYPQQPPFWH